MGGGNGGSASGRRLSGLADLLLDDQRQPLALRAIDHDPDRVVAGGREAQVPHVEAEGQDRVTAVGRAVGDDLGRGVRQLLAVRREEHELEVMLLVEFGRGHRQAADESEVRDGAAGTARPRGALRRRR